MVVNSSEVNSNFVGEVFSPFYFARRKLIERVHDAAIDQRYSLQCVQIAHDLSFIGIHGTRQYAAYEAKDDDPQPMAESRIADEDLIQITWLTEQLLTRI